MNGSHFLEQLKFVLSTYQIPQWHIPQKSNLSSLSMVYFCILKHSSNKQVHDIQPFWQIWISNLEHNYVVCLPFSLSIFHFFLFKFSTVFSHLHINVHFVIQAALFTSQPSLPFFLFPSHILLPTSSLLPFLLSQSSL